TVIKSGYSNSHMARGHEQEPIARDLYENKYRCFVDNGGFFHNGFTGCSPDGIVGNGIIEIKSVIASTHYKTLQSKSFDTAYKWQIIFNLKETQKDWLDFISFCNDFPIGNQLFVKRVHSSEFESEFKMIDERVNEFESLINKIKNDINANKNR
ncbi:MAG: YqaJ viral recombinase family protein, partial [Thiotrichaceae bacterium]|nr:YqaJ viral recombinase family protein [Thiotrichaceae bacterium]